MGYCATVFCRVLVPLSVAVLAMSACGGEPKTTVVGQICIQNTKSTYGQRVPAKYLHLIWSDGTFTLASVPHFEVGKPLYPGSDSTFEWLPAMYPVPCS
jgi:hypothetical protein